MDERMIEKDKTPEIMSTYIARLGDLELGNPEGIPSMYAASSDEELAVLAEQYKERVISVEDEKACACIDGRHAIENADGSPAVARLRRVGGSGANFSTAMNSGALVLDTFKEDATFGDKIVEVDAFVARATGFERSAHLGGCGGVNGEIADQKAINENPNIMKAVEIFMALPAVRKDLGVDFDPILAEKVRTNAGNTAKFLIDNNWDGQTYVDGVKETNPRCVEDLEVDHNDEKFHGHKENTLTIIIGDMTLGGDDDFVWNLDASKRVAEALSAGRDPEGYTQAIIAEIAKHMAVAHRLPGQDTPIILVEAHQRNFRLAA